LRKRYNNNTVDVLRDLVCLPASQKRRRKMRQPLNAQMRKSLETLSNGNSF